MTNDRTRRRFLIGGLLLLALALRVTLVLYLPGTYDGDRHRQDGYAYDSLALNLMHGFGLAVNRTSTLSFGDCPPCVPVSYPMPGYPLFLVVAYTLLGHSYVLIKLVQAVLDSLTALVVYWIALRITASHRTATLAFALAALNPFTSIWTADISTETLSTLLTTLVAALTLLTIERARPAFAVGLGVLLALNTYTRPAHLVLVVVPLAALALAQHLERGQAVRLALITVVTFAISFIPWFARNYLTFGHVVFSQLPLSPEQDHAFGYYAWYQNWLRDPTWTAKVNWDYVVLSEQSIPDEHPFPDYAYDSPAEKADVESWMREVKQTGRFTADVEARFLALANAKGRAHPLRRYIALPALRMVRAWINSGTNALNISAVKGAYPLARILGDPLGFATRLLLALAHSVLLPLALLGAGLLSRRGRLREALPVILPAAILTVVMEAAALGVQPRYIIYSVPSLLVLVAVGLEGLAKAAGRVRNIAGRSLIPGSASAPSAA